MKQKKRVVGFSIVALCVLAFMLCGGTTLINNVVSRLIDGNAGGEGVAIADPLDKVTCVVGDSDHNETFDVRDLVRLERYFGNVEENLVTDDCSLDGDWNVSGDLDDSEKATIYNYERIYNGDAEICLQMLVEDPPSLQVTAIEEKYYKQIQDETGRCAYYTLNKAFKEGWVLTFKIDFKENPDNSCSVSAYYPGCEEWLYLGEQGQGEYVVVATEYIPNLQIRVSNHSKAESVTDFRVYDIQVVKHEYIDDLEIVYNENLYTNNTAYTNVPQMPIVYGTQDTLDMTKFAVRSDAVAEINAESEVVKYDWTLSYNGELVDGFDITNTEYTFGNIGTYTITAKVVNNICSDDIADDIPNNLKANYSGEVSTTIKVVNPDVHINFNDVSTDANKGINIGSGNYLADYYRLNDGKTDFVEFDPTTFAMGIDGDENGSLEVTHKLESEAEPKSAYAVVNNYQFGEADFVISTWFYRPEFRTSTGKTNVVTNDSGSYLFGIALPDANTGFSVCLKPTALRFKLLDKKAEEPSISFNYNQWNNVTLCRENNDLELYFNGEMVYTTTLTENQSFYNANLAFGGYPGGSTYATKETCFDDIQVYGGELSADDKQLLVAPKAVKPDVEVRYNDGTIENTGTDRSVKANAYQLTDDGSEFTAYTDPVDYTTGIYGEKDGAIVTNYQQAPYTVIKDYPFGTNNFTVSTWFKIPDARGLSGDLTAYLLGTANPKDTGSKGFYVTISDGGALQLGVNGSAEPVPVQEFKANTWYNLVVCRSGDSLLFYLNGTLIHEATGIVATDFETKDIAFGAYTGSVATEYKNTKVHFDNIEVYKAAKTEEQIDYIVDSVTKRPDVYVSFDSNTVTNEGTNVDVIADTYGLDQRANSTMFIKQVVGSVENTGYVTGFDKTNTALNTYHKDGPYTVARDYVFGKENFTISTWFKVPSDQITTFTNSAGIYLFGTDHSDATEDFSVCIKSNDTLTQQLRVKILDQDPQFINLGKKGKYQVALDEWYHLTLMREGGTIQVFLDDELRGVYEIDENHDFGTTDLAFGGYYGFQNEYSDSYKHFDEVEVYKGALQGDIEQMVATTSSKIPDVAINYTGGIVKNYGRVNYNAYAATIGTVSDNPAFLPAPKVTFTTGMEGDENGAISMTHDTGAYTVVEGYKFNSGDFTISLCFNVPIDNSQKLPNNDTVYLFGTTASGENAAANGFSVCLKENNSDQYGLRLQVGSVTSEVWFNDFKRGTWNNLVLRRLGDNLYLYLNGVQVDANGGDTEGNVRSIAGQDFGVADLAFGGYYGKSNYNGNQMYFDNIQVNSEAFTEEYIKYAKTAADYRVDWALDKNLDMTTLFVGDGFFSPEVLTELGYADKAVKLAGIEGTTTYDWDMFADSYLTFTSPKNLVVHLGQHNIYDENDSAEETIQNLKSLLIKIHKIESYLNTQIYYCGIPNGSDATKDSVVQQVNEAMETWCDGFRWITYVDATDYDSVKTALSEVIVDNGLNFEADITYRTESKLNPTAKTLSTWINLPTDFADNSRGGVIWGNYKISTTPCVGYEIQANGVPRFYHVNQAGKIVNLQFTDVDVRDDDWVNLAFVIEEDNQTVSCYLNGDLKQKLKDPNGNKITLDAVTSVYALGGDLRTDNAQYFKGRIKELALYEGSLTVDDISALYTTGLDATTPIAHYKLQAVEEGQDITGHCGTYPLTARGRFYTEKEEVTGYDYSFAVIGDPQIVSINDVNYKKNGKDNSNLSKIYDWIVKNEESKKIQYVFNMGDITDGNLTDEWTASQTQNAKLTAAGIPYSVLRGNHDLVGYNRKTTDDDYTTDHFTNYMGTEAYREQFATGGFYTPDGAEKPDISNSWRTLTVGETNYLLLTLDYGVVSDIEHKNATADNKLKADAILAWAGKVISQHPTHKVILTTHAFMNYDENYLAAEHASNPSESHGTYDGDYLWDNFVSKYGNIVLVMSGHISSEKIVVKQQKGDYGNTVTSMLINFQDVDRYEELTGMVTMLYFLNGGKTIQVENYSTVKGAYFLEKNQFTIDIEDEIVVAPAVDIDFTGGTIANGTYNTFAAGQYKLDADKKFVDVTGEALFTTGRDGVANSALRLRHSLDYTNNEGTTVDGGAYVAVKGYDFGTDDFTLSTWFKLPENETVSDGAGTYLFGTNHPTATSGFSVCLKPKGIRIKAGENTDILAECTYSNDVWNQVVLCRRGGTLYLYLNGQSVLADGYAIGTADFSTEDLVFGGYSDWDNNYNRNLMDYDDIQVYHTGMTGDQLLALYNKEK